MGGGGVGWVDGVVEDEDDLGSYGFYSIMCRNWICDVYVNELNIVYDDFIVE